MLDQVKVEYYGTHTPLTPSLSLAQVTTPDANMIASFAVGTQERFLSEELKRPHSSRTSDLWFQSANDGKDQNPAWPVVPP